MDTRYNRDLDVAETTDVRRGMVMARDVSAPEIPATSPLLLGDEMRWGSVWGGFFGYLAGVLVFGSIAAALGLGVLAAGGAGAPTTGQIATTAGVAGAIVLLLSTFLGGFLTGWMCNLRSVWATAANGFVLGSLILAVPVVLSAISGAIAAAQQPGAETTLPGIPLPMLAANAGWFALGAILVLAVSSVAAWVGLMAHIRARRRVARY